MDIITAHKFSSKHRKSIVESEICGCFYCLEIFPPDKIIEWVDENEQGEGQTALCPRCEIDSVVGSKDVQNINQEFLKEMQKHWFGISPSQRVNLGR